MSIKKYTSICYLFKLSLSIFAMRYNFLYYLYRVLMQAHWDYYGLRKPNSRKKTRKTLVFSPLVVSLLPSFKAYDEDKNILYLEAVICQNIEVLPFYFFFLNLA